MVSDRLSYQVVQDCRTSSTSVYETLLDVGHYADWMPGVSAAVWERHGDPATELGSIRRIRVQRLTVREQITGGEAPHRHTYAALSGVPVQDYRAEIRIDDRTGGCLITWEASFVSRIPLIRNLIRKSMRSSIAKTAAALADEAQRRTETA